MDYDAPALPAELRLTLHSSFLCPLLTVLADGKKLGVVKRGRELRVGIAAGDRAIAVRISPGITLSEISLDIAAGESRQLVCVSRHEFAASIAILAGMLSLVMIMLWVGSNLPVFRSHRRSDGSHILISASITWFFLLMHRYCIAPLSYRVARVIEIR